MYVTIQILHWKYKFLHVKIQILVNQGWHVCQWSWSAKNQCIRKGKGHWACPIVVECREIIESEISKVTEHEISHLQNFSLHCLDMSSMILTLDQMILLWILMLDPQIGSQDPMMDPLDWLQNPIKDPQPGSQDHMHPIGCHLIHHWISGPCMSRGSDEDNGPQGGDSDI